MATDTVSPAVPGPPDPPATPAASGGPMTGTGAGSTPGWLAAIEPARPTTGPSAARPAGDDPVGKTDGTVDADGALDRSAPGASSATYRTADDVVGKGSDGAGMKYKRSVIKEFGLAMAQRWAKGGGTANKRLEMRKAQAQAYQVKEARTTTVMKSGGLPSRNNSTGGGGGRNSSGNSQGNGRTNSAGNNSGGAGRGGTGGGRGGSGSNGSPEGGGKHQGSGGKDSGSGKGGGKGAPGSSGSSRAGGQSSMGKSSGTGSGGKNSGSSGSSGSGKGPKNNGVGSSGGSGKAGGSGKDGASGKQGATGKDGEAGSSGSSGGGSGSGGVGAKKAGKGGKAGKDGGAGSSASGSGAGGKSPKASHGQDGVDRRTPLEKSRDIGHGDGGVIRNGVDHVKAYAKGAKDGWDDKKAENAREHVRLDKARDDHRKHRAGKDGQPKPEYKAKATQITATLGDGRTVVITTDEGDDGVSTDVKPLMVKEIDANALTLGTDGARRSVSRKELRTFKQYERKLEAKETHLIKIAEACKQLQRAAEKEAEDCQKLMEQARSVKGGENVAQKLSKLVDAAKNQATEAAELHKQAQRAAEMCKVVRTNIATRYAPLYKAVVDSDETKPAELRFYNDKGSYAPAA